jgi:hypothetical protein
VVQAAPVVAVINEHSAIATGWYSNYEKSH